MIGGKSVDMYLICSGLRATLEWLSSVHVEAGLCSVFVVQSFTAGRKGSIIADSPVQAYGEGHARRMAQRLADEKAFVVAFQRSGNAATGEYDDARLIAAYGDVPDEVLAMPRA